MTRAAATALGASLVAVAVATTGVRAQQATTASASQPPFPPPGVYRIGEPGVKPPVPAVQVKPEYTSGAVRAGLRGYVGLVLVVQADGSVGDIRVILSLDTVYGLDDKAIAAAKQWKFQPATKDGVAVPVLITLTLGFTLNGEPLPPPPSPTAPAPFSWPDNFAPAIDPLAGSGNGWTADTEEEDTVKLEIRFPNAWSLVRTPAQGAWVQVTTTDQLGPRVVYVGHPLPIAAPLVPMPQALLDQFATTMARMPGQAASHVRKTGQGKLGDRVWIWIDTDRPLDLSLFPQPTNVAGIVPSAHGVVFASSVGNRMVLVTCIQVQAALSEADLKAGERQADAGFSAILSRLVLTTR